MSIEIRNVHANIIRCVQAIKQFLIKDFVLVDSRLQQMDRMFK